MQIGYPLAESSGSGTLAFGREAGNLMHHLAVQLGDPCPVPPPLLAQAQLSLMPRQNVAFKVSDAIRAQA